MEPKEPLLLPSWESDDPKASEKSIALYRQRFISPVQTDEQMIEGLLNSFEMTEITESADDNDWGRVFPPIHKIGTDFLPLPEAAWKQLTSARYRKWKLPFCAQNRILFGMTGPKKNPPLYFFYDAEEHSFFDSMNNDVIFSVLRGTDRNSSLFEQGRYAEFLTLLNRRKAWWLFFDALSNIEEAADAEIILLNGGRKPLKHELLEQLKLFLNSRVEKDVLDLKEQPPAEYYIRFYNATTETFLSGNQSYFYYHNFGRIKLEMLHPEFERLNHELKEMMYVGF